MKVRLLKTKLAIISNWQLAIRNSLICLITFFALNAHAQGPYGNEWINFSQKYYKVRVAQTGLYRLTADQLATAGVITSSPFTDPRRIQIFYNGVEQYIYVNDANGNNHWDAGDYIEFFGQRNDGNLDGRMYSDPAMMPNPYYSLFTDTACYYITANASFNNRRMTLVIDSNYTSTPAPYFIKESYAELPQGYNYGWAGTYFTGGSGLGSSDHEYDNGEGWVGDQFTWGSPASFPLSTLNIYSSGPNAVFQTTVVGTGGIGQLLNQEGHHIRIRNTSPNYDVLDTGYEDYRQINIYESVPLSGLNSTSSTFEYSVTQDPTLNAYNDRTNTDYNSIGYARLTYPHTFQMENASSFKMWIPDASGGKSFLDMTQFNLAGSSTAALWDTTDHKLIYVSVYGNELKANVPNNNNVNPKFCYLAADGAVNIVQAYNISPVSHTINSSFTNFFALGASADSAYIIISTQALWTQAQQYQQYRNLTTGGRVKLVDIDELYDQFAYGIQKHPLAIKNFAHFILDKWTTVHPPQALFLMGKGLAAEDFRQYAPNFNVCQVPSYGEPCSDILLTSGINGTFLEPAIPTGRLAAQTGQNITDYLDKVKQYEDTQAVSPAPFWMKEVLHFGGGGDVNEQATFDSYLDNYTDIISGPSYGAHVDRFYSNSGQIATLAQSTVLHKLIDGGTSILTFFGHGSTVTFDQDIGEPSIYNNTGRYPILIANSCFAGDIFGTEDTKSEDFIFTPQKGSIAYFASTTIGYSTYLNTYTTALYRNISSRMYGKPMGAIIKQTIQDVETTDILTKQTCYEMTWHGDPLIHPNAWPKPDFSISQSDISFTPSTVTTDLDTFSIHVLLKNVGKATTDSFHVYVKRQYPDGTDSIYTLTVSRLYNEAYVSLKLRTSSFKAAGLNTFTVTLDIPDSVHEMQDFSNNMATATLFISSGDIIPVYPPQYAIIPYSTVTLKASTADPFAPMQSYLFEIDTTGDFNSPPSQYHKTTIVTSAGGVLQWANNIPTLQDSPVVYFWRVANDSILSDTVHFHWHPSSFTYIPFKTGWSQAHIDQFDQDSYNDVVYNRSRARDFSFLTSTSQIICTTIGNPLNQNQIDETAYTINGSQSAGEYSACGIGGPKLMIGVVDSLTLQAWSNNNNNYGQLNLWPGGNCRGRPENYFEYLFSDSTEMNSAVNLLLNVVPNNDYIIAYTYVNVDLSQYPNLVNAFSTLGATAIQSLGDVPYIFFVKKGSPATKVEAFGHSPGDTISIQATMRANWYYGTITSTLIGPASSWTALHWQSHAADASSPRDTMSLSIIGINNAGNPVVLRSGMSRTITDTTLSWISAATYPNLQLVAYLKDDSTHVPPQLDKWQVYYKGLPEAALNPSRVFSFHAPTMAEGDTVKMSIAIDNISDLSMDSMNVIFYAFDNSHIQHNISAIKLDSLRVGKSVTASVAFSSLGYSGTNSLWVEANPLNATHQPEQYHFNNLGQMKFVVNKDVINPILDVTFDGIHILDHDIVSAKPDIAIQLHDENKFLALDDTSKFRIYITTPTQALHQVYFHDINPATGKPLLAFTPAVLPNNSCRIDYTPTLSQDGTYQLQVEATDISLNESGRNNYTINFDVVNKSMITDVMNYPNPFSTSTRFVFTLTGSVIPSHFRIRIMTVSGKVVREIMLNELGSLHIGRNITDYAWNGKDEYGDQLANGLYLYQVTTDINGQTIDHLSTEADSYFKKGWGKMYLLR